MSRQVCGNCLCPFGDDGDCGCETSAPKNSEQVTVNGQAVWRDASNTWRWYDAVGPDVRKWGFDGASAVTSSTTMAGTTVTVTNGTLVTADSTTGGAVVLTVAGAENDEVNLQSFSEVAYFAQGWPAYFGIEFQHVDPTQSDIFFGWIIRDTDLAGGTTDGIYLRSVDGSAELDLVLEKSSAESTTTIISTLAAATDYKIEMYYDGSYVYVYSSGVLIASVADTDTNFCDDEHLCATVNNDTGEAQANNMTVYWCRAIQLQKL